MNTNERSTDIAIKQLEEVLRGLEHGDLEVGIFMFTRPCVNVTPPESEAAAWCWTGETHYQFTVRPTHGPLFDKRPTV